MGGRRSVLSIVGRGGRGNSDPPPMDPRGGGHRPVRRGRATVTTPSFGIFVAAKSKRIESFSYWQSGLLTPLFLVAGTFFPLEGLPTWAQVAGNLNPLYHCVELVR